MGGAVSTQESLRLSILPASPDSKLNEEQCKALVRSQFDLEVFDELKDGEGQVTVAQLLAYRREQRVGKSSDAVRKSLCEHIEIRKKDEEGNPNDEASVDDEVRSDVEHQQFSPTNFEGTAEAASDESTTAPPADSKRAEGSDLGKADLEDKKKELTEIKDHARRMKAEMVAAAEGGMDTCSWKEMLDDGAEREVELETEIGDIQDQAWEPVVKDGIVLFFYNW